MNWRFVAKRLRAPWLLLEAQPDSASIMSGKSVMKCIGCVRFRLSGNYARIRALVVSGLVSRQKKSHHKSAA